MTYFCYSEGLDAVQKVISNVVKGQSRLFSNEIYALGSTRISRRCLRLSGGMVTARAAPRRHGETTPRRRIGERAMAGKRDNAYYLQRLKKWPDIYHDVISGIITVAEGRRRAGLGGHRTRLHELKNAWTHATPSERRQFLLWAKSTLPAPPKRGVAGKSAWSGDGRMLDWAKQRIPKVMARRRIGHAELNDELGIKRSNQAVAGAIRNDNRVRTPATRAAVDRWLSLNATV